MSLYLDTSVIVSALSRESATPRVQAWFASSSSQVFVVSDWVVTEVSSALSMKVRMDLMTLDERGEAATAFKRLLETTFERLPVTRAHFETAARFAERHASGLRGGDALHLAVCADSALTLCTLDRRLAQAGSSLGVATQLL